MRESEYSANEKLAAQNKPKTDWKTPAPDRAAQLRTAANEVATRLLDARSKSKSLGNPNMPADPHEHHYMSIVGEGIRTIPAATAHKVSHKELSQHVHDAVAKGRVKMSELHNQLDHGPEDDEAYN